MEASVKKHGGHARVPLQDRSRLSFERVLDAAEGLLVDNGYAGLTLNDVSQRAKVSIGSIYGRVASKDDLVRALQVRVLDRIDTEHNALVNRIRRRELPLRQLMPVIARELATFLRQHAPILRVFMERTAADPVIAATGKAHFKKAALDFKLLILDRRSEIGHPQPEHAAETCFAVVYGALTRYLGLGSSLDVAGEGDWNQLIEDLGLMSLYFLIFDAKQAARVRGHGRR